MAYMYVHRLSARQIIKLALSRGILLLSDSREQCVLFFPSFLESQRYLSITGVLKQRSSVDGSCSRESVCVFSCHQFGTLTKCETGGIIDTSLPESERRCCKYCVELSFVEFFELNSTILLISCMLNN